MAPLPSTLRIGLGQVVRGVADTGLGNVIATVSAEGLVNLNEDGHARPRLAESWTTASDGLTLTLVLRRDATFHDGTPVTAPIVASVLQKSLPRLMGAAFEDVDSISAVDDWHLQIRLRQPSQFVIEALETLIQKPGNAGGGTGAYVPGASSPTSSELRANPKYYLGRPAIDRITLTTYPSVRGAWAELLRGNIDMLYEVNVDALDSLQGSSNVAVSSFTRHYQYMIIFGAHAEAFKSPELRRALNAAIDRTALIRGAFNGHGVESTGPVPPRHWAIMSGNAPGITSDPKLARQLAQHHIRFTCLVTPDSVYERVALIVQQQLAAASVDMQIKEATTEDIVEAGRTGNYDAILADIVSGPSLFRTYRQLYSKVPFAFKPRTSPSIDAALDRVRHAISDDDYRAGVTALQQAIVDDPPALFLAWGERARAVSRRFDVAAPQDGRDVLATLRLWHPAGVPQVASRN